MESTKTIRSKFSQQKNLRAELFVTIYTDAQDHAVDIVLNGENDNSLSLTVTELQSISLLSKSDQDPYFRWGSGDLRIDNEGLYIFH